MVFAKINNLLFTSLYRVYMFNKILPNTIMNFVPNKLIAVDDGESPWVTKKVKSNTLKKTERKMTMRIFQI